MCRRLKAMLATTSKAFPVILSLSSAALFALPAKAQSGPTVKSLVATHGSVSAGDITFTNFQTPATLPFVTFGAAQTNDGGDVQVTPITTPDGRMGLKFTAINPSTGQPQPFAVDITPGGAGGGKGGSGGAGGGLPGSLARNVTFDVVVANSQRLLANVDAGYGPGTSTQAGAGRFTFGAGAASFIYSLDPLTGAPAALVVDQYFATADSKSPAGGSPLPGGYLRSFRFGHELFMGGNPQWGGLSSGICMVDYYTLTFATVAADTPPPAADVQISYFGVTPVSGGSPTSGGVHLSQPAQAGGATVTLSSDNPGILTIPATVTIPQGGATGIFPASTGVVSADTYVPASATLNGKTVTSSTLIYAAPPLGLYYVQVPPASTAGPVQGTVGLTTATLSTLVTVTLSSNNPAVIVPSTVTIPMGASTASFPVTIGQISDSGQLANAAITASYAGTSTVANVTTAPASFVNFGTAEYWTRSKKINLQAGISAGNQSMTYGTNVNGPPLGPMALSGGPTSFKVTTGMNTAPSLAVIWVGAGGMVTKPVTLVDK